MSRIAIRIAILVFMLFPVNAAIAQEPISKMTAPAAAPMVTGTASAERFRFTAPGSVVQIQLQIYAESGQVLFDAAAKGNVLDWTLQDSGGGQLAPGSYLCVVTVKSLSGKLSQRIGSAVVQEKQAALQRVEATQLTLAQQQAVGPIEENNALTILNADEPPSATVVANNGIEGQMIRDRGALTFRIGNFFSGTDREQMRLTEDGKLGIGTAKPEAKLDVAGTIRAREGLMFGDGSTLNVNEKGVLTRTSADGAAPNAVASTQNRIARFTDNAGTVGDSVAVDTGTGLQLTAPANPSVDTNLIYLNSTNGTTGVLAGSTPSYSANNGPFFAMRGNTYSTIANQRGIFTISAGNVSSPGPLEGVVKFNTGNDQVRMLITPSGNVGIGTTSPATKLDVAGDVNTSTGYNVTGNRVFTVSIPQNNTLVGYTTGGNIGTGHGNSFFGVVAGVNTNSGSYNSFFGTLAGAANQSGTKNTIIGDSANVGASSLNYATAIGAEAVVSSSNTIALGRSNGADTVQIPGKLTAGTLSGYTVDAETLFSIGTIRVLSIGNLTSESTYLGDSAGELDASGDWNSLLGSHTNLGASNLTNATAVGHRAMVSQSNSLVLGSINGVNGASENTNVGIGTTAPVNILHLNGNHNDFALTFTNQSNTAGRRGYRIAFDSDRLTFQSADDSGHFAANQMAIDPTTGNVGIGVTAPSFKLHISDPSNAGLRVQTNTSGGTVASFGGNGAFQIDTISTAGGRLTVKENGNTGIGTNNPNAKLQVAGGNVYIANPNSLIITSPSGTCWLITVSNAGALSSIATPCP